VPTAVSLIAATFSILTYRRNRLIENENYIFKTKQESYTKILYELGTTIDLLQKYLGDLSFFIENRHEFDEDELEDELDERGNKIDDSIFNLENVIISYSLVTPKKVLDIIDRLFDCLGALTIPGTQDNNLALEKKKLDKAIGTIIKFANEINEEMRIDLNIEELNFSLYKRIKN
jgi:vacuolar-type H+-ATPase subunit I/STV1